jgi:hypothetical protein
VQRSRALDVNEGLLHDRGAEERSAPRFGPLSIVSDAVAGGGLQAVATSAHGVLGHPVVIAIPALGYPIVCPAGSVEPNHLALIIDYAAALIRGEPSPPPSVIGDSAPVRISGEMVGLVPRVRGGL